MFLPEAFENRMQQLLGDDFAAFINTYDKPKINALRVNPLKVSVKQFLEKFKAPLEPVPFCQSGFYYPSELSPGKHPFHQAGLYYIQEPSAMFVGETLASRSGERVLDLCAAPGGKSTHLASFMNNEGILISNEIHPKRVKALSENIERLGITNAIVTNEAPEKLAQKFGSYFDRILVDAPCSGEGMFRKDPDATAYWSTEHVQECALLQKDILESAYAMLKGGGTLVYSTCTFAPEENEHSVAAFIQRHPDMELASIEKNSGIASGQHEWVKWASHSTSQLNLTQSDSHNSIADDYLNMSSKWASGTRDLMKSARLWPHLLKGEGHYVAKLVKKSETPEWNGKLASSKTNRNELKDYIEFEKQVLVNSLVHDKLTKRPFEINRGQLFTLPEGSPDFSGLKVVRPGLHLGEFKKNRFEPNHAMAMALTSNDARHSYDIAFDSQEWMRYLKGETLQTGQDRGFLLVTIEGFPLGWGKEAKGTLKNFYPKGLRIQGG